MPGLWDAEHKDPHEGQSARALIRYNSLIEELRRRLGTFGVGSDDVLRKYRSFQSSGMDAPKDIPGLAFIGHVAQALHKNAREQIGKLRGILDIETLHAEHPDAHFKPRIAALDSLAETGQLVNVLGNKMEAIVRLMNEKKLKSPPADALPTGQEIQDIRTKLYEMQRAIKASRIKISGYGDEWNTKLAEAMKPFSAKQSPKEIQQSCKAICDAVDMVAGSILSRLQTDLEHLKEVPIRLTIGEKEERFKAPNDKRSFTNESGQSCFTSLAQVLVASKPASVANVARTLLRSVSNFNSRNAGVTDEVIFNANVACRAIRGVLQDSRKDLTPEQINDALDDAGFGFTPRQHGAVMKALNQNIRPLIKSADLIKGSRPLKASGVNYQAYPSTDAMATLDAIYRANGMPLPKADGVETVTEVGITLLDAGKKLSQEMMMRAGREIVKTGQITDIAHCRSLAGHHERWNDMFGRRALTDTQTLAGLKDVEAFLDKLEVTQKYSPPGAAAERPRSI